MNIEVGSPVKLKSGGEAMTVIQITREGGATCTWHSGGVAQFAVYPVAALELYDPSAPGRGMKSDWDPLDESRA
jgi:uncharacterized protein YodC (DUF2158 family)